MVSAALLTALIIVVLHKCSRFPLIYKKASLWNSQIMPTSSPSRRESTSPNEQLPLILLLDYCLIRVVVRVEEYSNLSLQLPDSALVLYQPTEEQ